MEDWKEEGLGFIITMNLESVFGLVAWESVKLQEFGKVVRRHGPQGQSLDSSLLVT
jgi:hypothetical protein